MNEKREGMMLINVTVAVFAGVLSSVLILIITHGFSFGEAIRDPVQALTGDHASAADDDLQDPAVPLNSTLLEATENSPDVSKELLQLQSSMAAATKERAQLAASIVELNRQVAELEANVINLSAMPVNQLDLQDGLASSEAMPGVGGDVHGTDFDTESPAERQFESLLAAGLDEQSARDLQLRADQYQLARLELFDQATREGWADSEQLDERLEVLNESQPDLRAELGETAYDSYLYESGRPNRVGIVSIIPGSAADQAGVQTGDLIFTYGDERIYSVQDLQDATRAGNRGEFVTLLVDRNSEIQRMDIERGPMGVTLQGSRQEP